MTELEMLRQQYIEKFSTPEDKLLAAINRETHLKVLNPRMISGPLQGKLLEFISRMLKPMYILEIGTYTGYSAICLAKGLAPGGKLITIERNEEIIHYPEKNIKQAGLHDQIEIRVGEALSIIPKLDYMFDLVFIDGDKKEYCDYFRSILGKVNQGGYLIADNVLWNGKVYQTLIEDDKDTLGIQQFNTLVSNDPSVENIILPIRDGINVIRKL